MESGLKDERRTWVCFHCEEPFTDRACAELHFGKFQDCTPICKVGAERYRDLEDQLAAYRSESDEASKTFYGMGAQHAVALRQAEEEGYEKGLRDGRAPSDAALVEALEDVTAHLAAAISLLSRSPKTGAASNKMFDQMLVDYDNSAARGRAALAAAKGQQP